MSSKYHDHLPTFVHSLLFFVVPVVSYNVICDLIWMDQTSPKPLSQTYI